MYLEAFYKTELGEERDYIYVYVFILICVCIYVFIYIYIYTYIYIHIHSYLYSCLYLSEVVRLDRAWRREGLYTYLFMYSFMCTSIFICIYVSLSLSLHLESFHKAQLREERDRREQPHVCLELSPPKIHTHTERGHVWEKEG